MRRVRVVQDDITRLRVDTIGTLAEALAADDLLEHVLVVALNQRSRRR